MANFRFEKDRHGGLVDVSANYSLAAIQDVQISATKRLASEKIEGTYPDWKQRNMLAAAVSLNNKRGKNGNLTAPEQAQEAALDAIWAWVAAVRQASDDIEAVILAETDPLVLVDMDVEARPEWPADL